MPEQVITASQQYPQGPNQFIQGAVSGVGEELAWSVLLGPVAPLEIMMAAYIGCMTSGNGGSGDPPPKLPTAPLADQLKKLSDRDLRRLVESLEGQAARAGAATRNAADTQTILDELLERGWKIEHVDIANSDQWMGGPHLDLYPPDGVPIHFPVPAGYSP